MRDRRFRFGVQAHRAPDGPAWTELARRAEGLGYSTLLVMDHFGDQLGPVPAMTAAATATAELRVGSLVFDNDYRHPVTLAKDIATVDLLSAGRVEFGVGAGWMRSDYEEAGILLEPAEVRIDRLEEAIAVVKGLWAPGPFSHEGRHYTITNLDGTPKPVQQPHPPVLLGGGEPHARDRRTRGRHRRHQPEDERRRDLTRGGSGLDRHRRGPQGATGA